MSQREVGRSFVVEFRYLVGGKWSRFYPQFEVRDARVRKDYSPRQQVRQLLLLRDQVHAQAWSQRIREGKRPLGQQWRIRLRPRA